jgi:hypothetical protein
VWSLAVKINSFCSDHMLKVRFQVLTAVSIKMTVFWYVVPCSLVEVYRRLRCAYCLHRQGKIALMMDVASTSEISVNFYQTTRCNIPEDSHLQLDEFLWHLMLEVYTEWR